MKVKEITKHIESVAPLSLQEHWDNSGLQIGNPEQDVCSVLLCTDITEDILWEAYEKQCQLVVSHHPLLFHGLKTIQGSTMQERCAVFAIKHNISIYSSHIPMDSYLHGVSGHIAEKLGIYDYNILAPTQPSAGLGVVGNLPKPIYFSVFLEQVAKIFRVRAIRYTPPVKESVQRIAVCGGAGSEFMQRAIEQQADVYLSADFKYHEFCDSVSRIAIVDIGHFESEQFTKEIFQSILEPFQQSVNLFMAENDINLVHTYIANNNIKNN